MAADESESGRYQASTVDALVDVVKNAVEKSPQSYAEGRSAQNPELMDLVEWTDISAGDWLAFSLLLRHTITDTVHRLLATNSR